MNLLLTETAARVIREAALRGARQGVEFGGSLLAWEGDRETLVAFAVPTGAGADQAFGHLVTDAEFQNEVLETVGASLPELTYVGDWHVHPTGMDHLSGTDLRTAAAILDDPAHGREELILLLGAPMAHGEPVIRGFHAWMDDAGLEVADVPPRLVRPDGEEVLERLGKALPDLATLLEASDAVAPAPVSHPAGARIREEVEELRALPGTSAQLRAADGLLGARITRGRREVVVVFPPEYPAGAPWVLRGSTDGRSVRPVPLAYGWSSLHRLTDVVGPALARHAPARPRPRRGLRAALAREVKALGRWVLGLPISEEVKR
ncbi:MAG: hypothetical protein ACQEXJ_20965 [Myxococcota bacterium]